MQTVFAGSLQRFCAAVLALHLSQRCLGVALFNHRLLHGETK